MQPFLDLVIHVTFDECLFEMVNKNEVFVFSGLESDCVKHSLAPYLGSSPVAIASLRAENRGKLHRWQRANIPRWNLMMLVVQDAMLMCRNGFTARCIRNAWTNLGRTSEDNALIDASVHLVKCCVRSAVAAQQFQLESNFNLLIEKALRQLGSGVPRSLARCPSCPHPLATMSWKNDGWKG